MVEPLQCRYAQPPQEMLVDGGYARLADIEHVALHAKVYAPVPKPKDESRDPHASLPGDAAAVAQWRARVGTEEAKAIYQDRAATAECLNALARNRG